MRFLAWDTYLLGAGDESTDLCTHLLMFPWVCNSDRNSFELGNQNECKVYQPQNNNDICLKIKKKHIKVSISKDHSKVLTDKKQNYPR